MLNVGNLPYLNLSAAQLTNPNYNSDGYQEDVDVFNTSVMDGYDKDGFYYTGSEADYASEEVAPNGNFFASGNFEFVSVNGNPFGEAVEDTGNNPFAQ